MSIPSLQFLNHYRRDEGWLVRWILSYLIGIRGEEADWFIALEILVIGSFHILQKFIGVVRKWRHQKLIEGLGNGTVAQSG